MRYADQRRRDYSSNAGDLLLMNGCGLSRWKTDFNNGTWFRIFPALDENGNPCRAKLSDEKWDYSDWMRAEPAALYVGEPGYESVHFHVLPQDWNELEAEYLQPPYVVFRDRIRRLSDQHDFLLRLLTKTGKSYTALPKPSTIGWVQAVIVGHAGKDYSATPKFGVALLLPSTARTALEEIIECGEYGDVTDPNTGKWLFAGAQLPGTQAQQQSVSLGDVAGRQGMDREGGKYEAKSYVIGVYDSYNGMSPELPIELCRQYWKPFDNVLRYLTIEEQVSALRSAFRSEVLKMGFTGTVYEKYLPESIRTGKTYDVPAQQAPPAPAPTAGPAAASSEPGAAPVPAQPGGVVSAPPMSVQPPASLGAAQPPAQQQAQPISEPAMSVPSTLADAAKTAQTQQPAPQAQNQPVDEPAQVQQPANQMDEKRNKALSALQQAINQAREANSNNG